MILALFGMAFAGSIALSVESIQGASPDYVDFGMVANRRGPPPAVGRRVKQDQGTFLVVNVSATAHWVADASDLNEPLMYRPVLSSRWQHQRAPAPESRADKPKRRRLTMVPTPQVRVAQARVERPVTRVDLYARNTSTVGGGSVWYAPAGATWDDATQVEIGMIDTLIARDVPVDELFRHQLGMWVPSGEAGMQIQRVVYTAMIP